MRTKRENTYYNSVLTELKAGRSLTSMDALQEFGCFRLADVIYRLREDGYNVVTGLIERQDARPYAIYSMEVPTLTEQVA